ncbi:MAG TPA: slipin family protein [Gemmatales bacterium]|nr:slipin family protein [Gemmatales bacterium]HMP17992.1 slipin family protein [Gemmatales bacterium]
MFLRKYIRQTERGLLFYREEFIAVIGPGLFHKLNLFGNYRLEVMDRTKLWLNHARLDELLENETLRKQLQIIDLKDYQRALVWVDGRFHGILSANRYAFWTGVKEVQLEVIDARTIRFEHEQLDTMVHAAGSDRQLSIYTVEPDEVGVLFVQGKLAGVLSAGRHAFWTGLQTVKLCKFSLREAVLDIPGQEILTADKVTLRLNAVVSYRISDPVKAVTVTEDARQALYRETQLALRSMVGTRELDTLLGDKEALGQELLKRVHQKALFFGVSVQAVGIRDLILPGEMRELFHKVIEARKAAEANLIARREETAALRHQTNTAKLLAENPTLLRLRELETLEKVAIEGDLKIILGEKGLAERVVHML